MEEAARKLAKIVWDYHHLGHCLKRTDAILVFGSHDYAVAEWAAKLFLEQYAPLIVISGGFGTITRKLRADTEAREFANIAMQAGVPEESILLEEYASNTGENVLFTKALLEERGLSLDKFILVQKPYMERRTFATFKKLWPGKEIILSSSPESLDQYLARYASAELDPDFVVSIMVGDLQRIREYPARGYQIEQDIPDFVWQAYEELVGLGYTRHLISQ